MRDCTATSDAAERPPRPSRPIDRGRLCGLGGAVGHRGQRYRAGRLSAFRPLSSVVEHRSCKAKVVGSTPTEGSARLAGVGVGVAPSLGPGVGVGFDENASPAACTTNCASSAGSKSFVYGNTLPVHEDRQLAVDRPGCRRSGSGPRARAPWRPSPRTRNRASSTQRWIWPSAVTPAASARSQDLVVGEPLGALLGLVGRAARRGSRRSGRARGRRRTPRARGAQRVLGARRLASSAGRAGGSRRVAAPDRRPSCAAARRSFCWNVAAVGAEVVDVELDVDDLGRRSPPTAIGFWPGCWRRGVDRLQVLADLDAVAQHVLRPAGLGRREHEDHDRDDGQDDEQAAAMPPCRSRRRRRSCFLCSSRSSRARSRAAARADSGSAPGYSP